MGNRGENVAKRERIEEALRYDWGSTDNKIAVRLGVSPHTVEKYRRAMKERPPEINYERAISIIKRVEPAVNKGYGIDDPRSAFVLFTRPSSPLKQWRRRWINNGCDYDPARICWLRPFDSLRTPPENLSMTIHLKAIYVMASLNMAWIVWERERNFQDYRRYDLRFTWIAE
jgi:DNA-binding CsgD family transcriptional regulator